METKNKLTRFKKFVMAAAVAAFGMATSAQAEEFTLHFSDPVGDATPYLDVTGMDFTFDSGTGAYRASIFTSSTEPLHNGVWVDLWLLNLNRTEAQLGSALVRGGGIFVAQPGSERVFELIGVSSELTTWSAGDTIAPGQFEAPPVTGSLPPEARSGNTQGRYLSDDGIAFWYKDDMGIGQSAILQVPEPSALLLAVFGLGALMIFRRITRGRLTAALLATASIPLIGTAKAEELTLHFTDPVGEVSTVLDFTGMDFSFNPATGDYRARIFSSDAIPFPSSGNLFHIYLNLVNLDRQASGTGFELLSIVQDHRTVRFAPDYIDLAGTSSILTSWQAGDKIAPGQTAASPAGLNPPPHYSRNTALIYGDSLGLAWPIDDMGIDQVAIVQVPEPSTLLLSGLGLSALLLFRHKSLFGRKSQ